MAKNLKHLIFIDFAVVHPLQGKVKDVFFSFYQNHVTKPQNMSQKAIKYH